MAVWPFGKKNKKQDETPTAAGDETQPAAAEAPAAEVADTDADEQAAGAGAPAKAAAESAGVEHDAINGATGPFDGDNVNIDDFDFSDFAAGILDLGSMKVAMPKGAQVQVEMGEKGPKMLHLVTPHGRITPVAFAAPTTGGQWESASEEIINGMRGEGNQAHFEQGPWGREVVAAAAKNAMRIIGIDGPRWMLRMTVAAPADKAESAAQIAREIAARTFVYRGTSPILAGNSLPVTLPPQLVEQVQKAVAQRAEQNKANKQAVQNAQESEAVREAAQALRNLNQNPPENK